MVILKCRNVKLQGASPPLRVSLPDSSFSAQGALSSWGAGPRLPLLWNPSKPHTVLAINSRLLSGTLSHINEFFRLLLLHLNIKVIRY